LTDNLEKYLNEGDFYHQTSFWCPEDECFSEKNYDHSKNEDLFKQDTTHDQLA